MGLFSFLFGGKYPSTKSYENKCLQHEAEYKRYLDFAKSSELARYSELKSLVESSDFKAKVNKLKNERFADTEAAKKENEYKALASSADIKSYFNIEKKVEPKLQSALSSQNYATYVELKAEVESPEFIAKTRAKDFKKSPDFQTLKRYQKAAKSSEVKFINKTQPSQAYRNYLATKSGSRLARYEELGQYVASSEFKAFKADMTDKKRFEKSEECGLLKEFDKLSKSKDLLWYNKCTAAHTFADLAKWKMTFQDEFDGGQLDSSKWTFGYYWGQALMNGVYSLDKEKQAFEKNNARVYNSELTLSTVKSMTRGKAWQIPTGFVDKDFEFSSACVNTGASFRQKYGRFEFKVKFDFSKPLTHNIWLAGEKSMPQINIANYGTLKAKQIETSVITKDGNQETILDGADFSSGYYILSLLWTPEKMVWSVNGVEAFTIRKNVPQEPMYIVMSSNLTEDAPKLTNSAMVVDWVRVYTWQE